MFWCFTIMHTPLGSTAEADQNTACVQMANCSVPLGALLLNHSHLQAHSAASVALWVAVPLLLPSESKKLKAVDRDLTVTSAGNLALQVVYLAVQHIPQLLFIVGSNVPKLLLAPLGELGPHI